MSIIRIIPMDILFVHQLQSKWAGKKRDRQFASQSGDELYLKLVWNGANKMLLSAWALNVDIQDWRLKFYSSINAAIIGNHEKISAFFAICKIDIRSCSNIHIFSYSERTTFEIGAKEKTRGIYCAHNINFVIAVQGFKSKCLSLSACNGGNT